MSEYAPFSYCSALSAWRGVGHLFSFSIFSLQSAMLALEELSDKLSSIQLCKFSSSEIGVAVWNTYGSKIKFKAEYLGSNNSEHRI